MRFILALLITTILPSTVSANPTGFFGDRLAPPRATTRMVLKRAMPKFRDCYEAGLDRRPDLKGKISLRIVVNPDGKVQSATVRESSLGDKKVESCAARVARGLRFFQDRGMLIISYPIIFTTTEASEPPKPHWLETC